MDKAHGIIIRTTDYKDKDKILTIFTGGGIITATAKGVRSASSKLKSYTTVMTLCDFSFVESNGRLVLSGAEYIDNFYDAWGDFDKNSAITFCFELSEKCFVKEDNTVEEFLMLLKSLKEIVYGESIPICSALKYGIYCAERVGVDYSGINDFDSDTYAILKAFCAVNSDEVGSLQFSENAIKKALSLLHVVLKNYLGVNIVAVKNLIDS